MRYEYEYYTRTVHNNVSWTRTVPYFFNIIGASARSGDIATTVVAMRCITNELAGRRYYLQQLYGTAYLTVKWENCPTVSPFVVLHYSTEKGANPTGGADCRIICAASGRLIF